MSSPWYSDKVLSVCRTSRDAAPAEAIVPEPYLPHVPPGWNGVLVLAEAQQLAGADEYRTWLQGLPSERRMTRLPRRPGYVGVGPWDNGDLPLAVKAMLPEVDVSKVGVSNAVPWSCQTASGSNRNPTEAMVRAAIDFWRSLLDAWQPEFRLVVTVGKIARQVVSAWERDVPRVALRSSSPRYVNQVMGLFDLDDLLRRYPEVKRAAEAMAASPGRAQLFFACHAASMGGKLSAS